MKHTTKKHLCKSVSKQTRIPMHKVEAAVNATLSCMTDFLLSEATIELRGFATFQVRDRKPRPARNPRTGEVVPLPQRKTIFATFPRDFKKSVDFRKEIE